jgi:hypothetical protein
MLIQRTHRYVAPQQRVRRPELQEQAFRSDLDGRTTRHAISQRKRKLIEQVFGWKKTIVACGNCVIGAASWSIGS